MYRACIFAGLFVVLAGSIALGWAGEGSALTLWQQISYAAAGLLVMSLVLFLLPEKPRRRDDRKEFGGS